MVEFYSDMCSHCWAFQPKYEQLATSLKPCMNIGAVNDIHNFLLLAKLDLHIMETPSFYLFAANKSNPIHYTGHKN